MSDAAKLRRQLRRKKLLDYLDTANRNSLAVHTHRLARLQQTAADLDNGGQNNLDSRFLDVRTAYRNSLEPQIRSLSEILAVEAGRAEVLRRRVEDTVSDIKVKEARIQDASDLEHVLDQLNRNRIIASTAPHKPHRQ